ncbi:TRAP transporter TatT component family protein [bacterium]|nr:TRAP transporter TatT component family protein [bacterium]
MRLHRQVKLEFFLLAAFLLISVNGCGVRQMVVRSATAPIIDGGFSAMMAEEDLALAKTALESNLKLIEGLLVSDPENSKLTLLASQGFTAYSLGFVEDEAPERAVKLYKRGRDYGSRWLKQEFGVDLLAIDSFSEFEQAVADLPAEAVPGVFWMANSWASSLLLSLNDISAISNLPRVEAMMRFVLEHDEFYYFGGAHLFFGAYYGARSTFLGGSPDKARDHLDRQWEMTNGSMLLGRLFRVKYVDLPALDGEAARSHLEEILNQDLGALPEGTRLINRVTQSKAQTLLENLEDYL